MFDCHREFSEESQRALSLSWDWAFKCNAGMDPLACDDIWFLRDRRYFRI